MSSRPCGGPVHTGPAPRDQERPMTTSFVTSADGTRIAYEKAGNGPVVVLVDGAFGNRGFGPSKLAAELAGDFTVFTYDRRGRNESGDTAPYAVERELEDLGAVVEAAGGSASGFGISSGAALTLEAAAAGVRGIERIALYEPPFIVDDSRTPVPAEFDAKVAAALATDQRGEAVRLFMRDAVQVPYPMVAAMRFMPMWRKLKAVAHTLPYDF